MRKIVIFGIVVIFIIFVSKCKRNEKVVYSIPCGVPRVWVNPMSLDTEQGQFMIDYSSIWKKRELQVFFMDDAVKPEVADKILRTANEWSLSANVKFLGTNYIGESDIRIEFSESNGYKSLVGSNASNYKYQATMSLGRLDVENDIDKIKSVVLHEFGHSLGLLHELSNPKNPIKWDRPEVYKYFDSVNGWSKTKVDEMVLKKIEIGKNSLFDMESIMTYPIPSNLTLNDFEIPVVTKLSKTDKENISIYYD